MTKWNDGDKYLKHCRWCSKPYEAHKPVGMDGFCCDAHKMAHARAYKKYVTRKKLEEPAAAACRNFQVTKKGDKNES